MIYLISDLYNEMIELYTCETYISIHWGIVDFLQLSKVLAGQTHDPVVQLVLLVTRGHHGVMEVEVTGLMIMPDCSWYVFIE